MYYPNLVAKSFLLSKKATICQKNFKNKIFSVDFSGHRRKFSVKSQALTLRQEINNSLAILANC